MKRILITLIMVLALASALADKLPNYSDVKSRDDVQVLVEKGELVAVLLFPAEFGGDERGPNIVFVPREIAELKDRNTATLVRYVEEELIDQLEVNPKYKGDSLVPSAILIKAWHSAKEGKFDTTIEVW